MGSLTRYNVTTGVYEPVGPGAVLSQSQQDAINAVTGKLGIGSNPWLKELVLSQGFLLTGNPPTYDATSGTLTGSTIAWPDGVTGSYSASSLDANGAVTAFVVTYLGSPTRTVTVTVPRNANSQVNAPMTAIVS